MPFAGAGGVHVSRGQSPRACVLHPALGVTWSPKHQLRSPRAGPDPVRPSTNGATSGKTPRDRVPEVVEARIQPQTSSLGQQSTFVWALPSFPQIFFLLIGFDLHELSETPQRSALEGCETQNKELLFTEVFVRIPSSRLKMRAKRSCGPRPQSWKPPSSLSHTLMQQLGQPRLSQGHISRYGRAETRSVSYHMRVGEKWLLSIKRTCF